MHWTRHGLHMKRSSGFESDSVAKSNNPNNGSAHSAVVGGLAHLFTQWASFLGELRAANVQSKVSNAMTTVQCFLVPQVVNAFIIITIATYTYSRELHAAIEITRIGVVCV